MNDLTPEESEQLKELYAHMGGDVMRRGFGGRPHPCAIGVGVFE
jgi:hypothetical protein